MLRKLVTLWLISEDYSQCELVVPSLFYCSHPAPLQVLWGPVLKPVALPCWTHQFPFGHTSLTTLGRSVQETTIVSLDIK